LLFWLFFAINKALVKFNLFFMKNVHRFLLYFLVMALLLVVVAGCGGGKISNENDSGNEIFGSLAPGTECLQQLHGGCVPSDYRLYDGNVLGIHFSYPKDWNNVSAAEAHLEFVPRERSGDDDITRLFIWRQSAVDAKYEEVKKELVQSGIAENSPWDSVNWSIYKGTWNNQPVQAEWVEFITDPNNPWVNYVVFMITEAENFQEDQMVLRGVASSIQAIATTL